MKLMLDYLDYILEHHSEKVGMVKTKWYPEIKDTDFDQIVSADPTSIVDGDEVKKMGKYSKWLLQLFLHDKLLIEDLYKATEYLTIHNKNLYRISKGNKEYANVFNFEDIVDLYEKIKRFDRPADAKDEDVLISNRYYVNNKKANLVFEDKNWLIVSPLTIEAAQFYSEDAQWCTKRPNQFDSYTKRSPLFIFIDKNKLNTTDVDRRIQLHIDSKQFKNMLDREDSIMILSYFKKLLPDLVKDVCKKWQLEMLDRDQIYPAYMRSDSNTIMGLLRNYDRFDHMTDVEYDNILGKVIELGIEKVFNPKLLKNREIDTDNYKSVFETLPPRSKIEFYLRNSDEISDKDYDELLGKVIEFGEKGFDGFDKKRVLNTENYKNIFNNLPDRTKIKLYLNDPTGFITMDMMPPKRIGDIKKVEKYFTYKLTKKDREEINVLLNRASNGDAFGKDDIEFLKSKPDRYRIKLLLAIVDNNMDIQNLKPFLMNFRKDLQFMHSQNGSGIDIDIFESNNNVMKKLKIILG